MKTEKRTENTEPRAGQPDPVTIALVEQLASKSPLLRQDAERALAQGDAHVIDSLLFVLERENRKKARRFWTALVVFELAASLLGAALSTVFSLNLTFISYGLAAPIAIWWAPTPLQRSAARAVADLNDPRAVGPLLEALDRQDDRTKRYVQRALVRLLPKVQHDEVDLAEVKRHRRLRGLLGGNNNDLIDAALQALQKVGDADDLPAVKRLADRQGAAKKDATLMLAAQKCLPVLEARIEAERLRMTLLRPAAAPDDPAAVLLRPAHGVGEADPELLLRPSTGPDDAGATP